MHPTWPGFLSCGQTVSMGEKATQPHTTSPHREASQVSDFVPWKMGRFNMFNDLSVAPGLQAGCTFVTCESCECDITKACALHKAHLDTFSTWTSIQRPKGCHILHWTTIPFDRFQTPARIPAFQACLEPMHCMHCAPDSVPRLNMLMLWNRVWVRVALGKSFRTGWFGLLSQGFLKRIFDVDNVDIMTYHTSFTNCTVSMLTAHVLAYKLRTIYYILLS